LEPGHVESISRSPEDTQNIGRTLGANAKPGQVFLLVGELGTGKTCLTQGVLWGLGGDEYARSPSYVLVSQYQGRLTMYHIDLYRLGTSREVADLGLDEYLNGDGLCVVEWADRAPALFLEGHLKIRIERLGQTERRLALSTTVPGYAALLSAVSSGTIEE
jgi:tRNA threonylcarbamoyladenosine biosynthesis protein TsaE